MGGGVGGFSHMEVWAPNIFRAEAEPLPPAVYHPPPPAWSEAFPPPRGWAMRQRILGSHTPPCHRRMVITTEFIVLICGLLHCSADLRLGGP